MKVLFKSLSLMIFSFGMAVLAKHYDFAYWIEANTWVALPLILFGGVGIILLWGDKN